MKIITWNVNGLRAAIEKGAWDWMETQEAEAICLQEIKVKPEQLSPEQKQRFSSYHEHWNPAERPGYSGVATFTRQPPLEFRLGLGDDRFDHEGRVVQTRFPDFTLFNIYFPNGQRGHDRVQYKLDFYACLLELCDRMHAAGEKVVLCGDFNTAHREIDLRHPKANANTSGFLPEERVWIDYYLDHGLVDPFRILYPDRVAYTWWTYIGAARQRNVGWRIDYFMISADLVPAVQDVVIHTDIMGSDHCPVSLILS